MATRVASPTSKAQQFIYANSASPLVYQSYDEERDVTTFRLDNGHKFELSKTDCLSMRDYFPRWRCVEG